MSTIRSPGWVNRSTSHSGLTSVPGRIEPGISVSCSSSLSGWATATKTGSDELTGLLRLAIILGQNRRGSGSVVEHLLAKEKVAGSNPVFRSSVTRALPGSFRVLGSRHTVCSRSRVLLCGRGGMADAAVLKTAEGQPSCGFESRRPHQAGRLWGEVNL